MIKKVKAESKRFIFSVFFSSLFYLQIKKKTEILIFEVSTFLMLQTDI